MARRSDPIKPKKAPKGDYASGYARPPKRGQIKPGEVRNPRGINRKEPPAVNDPFEDAMKRLVSITIDGKTMQVSTEAAMWLKNSLVAVNDIRAFKIVAEERRSRRYSTPTPTAAELAAEAEELEKKKRLAAQLVQLLQDAAARKKRGDVS